MFAHQVIEDLQKLKPNWFAYESDDLDQDMLKHYIRMIKNSHQFHFGDGSHIADLIYTKNMYAAKQNLFEGPLRKEIYPPYKVTWFDCTLPKWAELVSKVGFLVIHLQRQIVFWIFEHSIEIKTWISWPIMFAINLDDERGGYLTNWNPLYAKKIRKWVDFNGLSNHTMFVGYLNFFLMFINCKNIGTQRVEPSKTLNKKRIKNGKQPLFTYHTLVLKPVGKKQESIPRHLWHNRIHFQRGHFKTYTAEKPLFGHITGRFWWQPHVRGKNKDGIVMKDYVVDARG